MDTKNLIMFLVVSEIKPFSYDALSNLYTWGNSFFPLI